MDTPVTYSIVLPAFNEAANVAPMTERILRAIEPLGESFEIVWVNDGSGDDTAGRLDRLAEAEPRVRALHLSRNFGHMAALTAGLEAARGVGAVISLDADGQHPPELIPEMVRLWREGADIVQALRKPDPRQGAVKSQTSRLFYRVFNFLSDVHVQDGAADFRLMDREAVDALNSLPERVRFMRGLVHWIGYHRVELPYEQEDRISGDTKYTLARMLALALGGLTSFSTRPLRLAFVLTLFALGSILTYVLFVLYALTAGFALAPGWTSLMFVMLSLGAAQLLVIGVASEYLARMFTEQKHRPVYLLRKRTTERRPRHE